VCVFSILIFRIKRISAYRFFKANNQGVETQRRGAMSGQSGQLTSFLAVDQLNEILAVVVVVGVIVVIVVVIAVGGVLIALKNMCKSPSVNCFACLRLLARRHK